MRVERQDATRAADIGDADRLRAAAGQAARAAHGAARLGSARVSAAPASSSPAPRSSRGSSRPQRAVAVRAAARARRRSSPTRSSSATGPEDLRAALDFLAREGMDLILTSGGLGPTADDLTAEVVADFAGPRDGLDAALEERIWAVVERLRRALARLDEEAMRAGNRKQALVPEGATVLEPVGTAPGLLVPRRRRAAGRWCCPGRRASCSRCGRPRSETEPLRDAAGARRRAGAADPALLRRSRSRRSPRRCASWRRRRALAARDHDLPAPRRDRGRDRLRARRRRTPTTRSRRRCASATATRCSPPTARRSTTVVARLLGRVRTVATAESCTGGLMAGRLTDRAGSSAYVLGGRRRLLERGQDRAGRGARALIERHGAVSPEVAAALADGRGRALRRRHRDRHHRDRRARAAARPRSRSGRCACRSRAARSAIERTVRLPGNRADVRDRTTTVALHMLRGCCWPAAA